MQATMSLSPRYYYAENVYLAEQQRIFANAWIFVGFKHQLSQNNDFITKEIAGIPVVIQNFNGELSALLNVCSHRKARIQTAKQGNRALRCPYHCWSFKADGALGGVPQQRTDFGFSEQDKQKLALKKFRVQSCGNFVFVCLSEQSPNLDVFLGAHLEILQELSEYFVDAISQGTFHWKTNWKLAVETVLEVYHVAGVHPESFAKLAKPECIITDYAPHNAGFTPLTDTTKQWWARVRKQLKLKQHPEYTEYNHFFIYPNLAIGLTNGSLMSVQTYDPTNITECELNFNLMMVGINDGISSDSAFKVAVTKNFTDFNQQTLIEDQMVAESCQKNMPISEMPAVLGLCEQRLVLFHQAWKNAMAGEFV